MIITGRKALLCSEAEFQMVCEQWPQVVSEAVKARMEGDVARDGVY
jgi:hypothetical protein